MCADYCLYLFIWGYYFILFFWRKNYIESPFKTLFIQVSIFIDIYFIFCTFQLGEMLQCTPQKLNNSGSNSVRLTVGAKATSHLQNILLSRYSNKRKYFKLPVALE